MLYLAIEPEALRFYSLHDDDFQETVYRLQPALNFSRNLRQALAQIPSTATNERAVRVLTSLPGTAMPLNEFSEEVAESVFRHCFSERDHERVFYDMIPQASAVWLFAMPKEQCEAIEQLFSEVYYASIMAPIARYAFQHAGPKDRVVQVQVRQGWADVVALREGRLIQASSYPTAGPTDVAYHTLNVMKRSQMDVQSDLCVLMGGAALREPAVRELSRFVTHLESIEPPLEEILRYLH